MAKQSTSNRAIVQQAKPSLPALRTEDERKGDLIQGYLQKYALIDGKVITPDMLNVYLEALEDFDLRVIEKGMKRYLQQGSRWPWPGTLAEYIEEEI